MSAAKETVKEQRAAVKKRAKGCCEYCLCQEAFSASVFSVEHIAPRSAGGLTIKDNLALSCQDCNNHKFTATAFVDPITGKEAALFHPRIGVLSEHFAWSEDYSLLIGLTPTGRATIERLQLNRPRVVNLRRVLRQTGNHPPNF